MDEDKIIMASAKPARFETEGVIWPVTRLVGENTDQRVKSLSLYSHAKDRSHLAFVVLRGGNYSAPDGRLYMYAQPAPDV